VPAAAALRRNATDLLQGGAARARHFYLLFDEVLLTDVTSNVLRPQYWWLGRP
jgi:hypothetical protein